MPRRGQRLKTRKRAPHKPPGPRVERIDPLANLRLTHLMSEHFEALRASGYTADTVRARRIAIRRFIGWVAERGIDEPREITRELLERYQRSLFFHRKADGRALTIGTQLGCLAPLKTFFKWLARERHVLYNAAAELQLPRQTKQLPRTILTVAEVEAILAEADPGTPAGLRDRAMLETLYSTGLRRMELPGLALYDIDFARSLVIVREGKGRRDRIIPIGARALAWVERYLAESRPKLLVMDRQALFLTDYGEPINPEFVAARVKCYMGFAGIDKPGAAHLFRHACATHMLENGADIRFIQAMLSHANLQTTEIYTHVSVDKLREIHAATHPAKLERDRKALDAMLDEERDIIDDDRDDEDGAEGVAADAPPARR